jgi:hypothetical protein
MPIAKISMALFDNLPVNFLNPDSHEAEFGWQKLLLTGGITLAEGLTLAKIVLKTL